MKKQSRRIDINSSNNSAILLLVLTPGNDMTLQSPVISSSRTGWPSIDIIAPWTDKEKLEETQNVRRPALGEPYKMDGRPRIIEVHIRSKTIVNDFLNRTQHSDFYHDLHNLEATVSMKASLIISFGFVSMIMASSTSKVRRQAYTCGSGDLNCCDVDVLGIADLDCEAPPSTPTDLADFVSICSAVGKADMCCTLDLLDQGLLCTSPSNGGTGRRLAL